MAITSSIPAPVEVSARCALPFSFHARGRTRCRSRHHWPPPVRCWAESCEPEQSRGPAPGVLRVLAFRCPGHTACGLPASRAFPLRPPAGGWEDPHSLGLRGIFFPVTPGEGRGGSCSRCNLIPRPGGPGEGAKSCQCTVSRHKKFCTLGGGWISPENLKFVFLYHTLKHYDADIRLGSSKNILISVSADLTGPLLLWNLHFDSSEVTPYETGETSTREK